MEQKLEHLDQKNKKGRYIILTGFIICILIFAAFLIILYPDFEHIGPSGYNISFNQTKTDNDYNKRN